MGYCQIIFTTGIACNRPVVYCGRAQQVAELAPQLTYRWDTVLQTWPASVRVERPGYGQVKLVVTREVKGVKNDSTQI